MLGQGPFETSRFVRKRTEECLLNAETPRLENPGEAFSMGQNAF